MAVMGTDSVILDDLRGRVAELEALVPRLFSVIAEKDAIIAELTATVKVTQGTRGETGERWCERAWTAVMTCRKQGLSAFEFFREAVRAYTNDAPAPSLLKNP